MNNENPIFEEVFLSSAANDDRKIYLSEKGKCRFCRSSNAKFRNISHAIPESLGNKWFISRDECDECNKKFQVYDQSIVEFFQFELLVRNAPNKKRGRQIGRTSAPFNVATNRQRETASLKIKINSATPGENIESFKFSETIQSGSYVPQLVYKGIVKSALSFVPQNLVAEFRDEIAWINSPNEAAPLTHGPLLIGISSSTLHSPTNLAFAGLFRTPDNHHLDALIGVRSLLFHLTLRPNSSQYREKPYGYKENSEYALSINGLPVVKYQPIKYSDFSSTSKMRQTFSMDFLASGKNGGPEINFKMRNPHR